MLVTEIKLFELLKARIGEKEAEAFIEIMETTVDRRFEEAKGVLATKQDMLLLKEDFHMLRTEMNLFKAEIIKWMFVFWVGQMGAMVLIIKLLH